MTTDDLLEEVALRFQYRAPTPDQVHRYERLRARAHGFAQFLVTNCPQSRELSTALTKLDEVVMHANAAIARREPQPEETPDGG